jgi:DNA-binding SARP family transcriptional activator
VEFRLLGPFEVLDGGRSIALGSPKQRALLAILAIHANEPLSADVLIDELWDEEPPESARNTLQAYVSRLRKALDTEEADGNHVIESLQAGYVLRTPIDSLDTHRFEQLLDKGRALLDEGEPQRASRVLEDALTLWRGVPLGDFQYERFAESEIVRLTELRVAALETRIDAELAAGRHARPLRSPG